MSPPARTRLGSLSRICNLTLQCISARAQCPDGGEWTRITPPDGIDSSMTLKDVLALTNGCPFRFYPPNATEANPAIWAQWRVPPAVPIDDAVPNSETGVTGMKHWSNWNNAPGGPMKLWRLAGIKMHPSLLEGEKRDDVDQELADAAETDEAAQQHNELAIEDLFADDEPQPPKAADAADDEPKAADDEPKAADAAADAADAAVAFAAAAHAADLAAAAEPDLTTTERLSLDDPAPPPKPPPIKSPKGVRWRRSNPNPSKGEEEEARLKNNPSDDAEEEEPAAVEITGSPAPEKKRAASPPLAIMPKKKERRKAPAKGKAPPKKSKAGDPIDCDPDDSEGPDTSIWGRLCAANKRKPDESPKESPKKQKPDDVGEAVVCAMTAAEMAHADAKAHAAVTAAAEKRAAEAKEKFEAEQKEAKERFEAEQKAAYAAAMKQAAQDSATAAAAHAVLECDRPSMTALRKGVETIVRADTEDKHNLKSIRHELEERMGVDRGDFKKYIKEIAGWVTEIIKAINAEGAPETEDEDAMSSEDSGNDDSDADKLEPSNFDKLQSEYAQANLRPYYLGDEVKPKFKKGDKIYAPIGFSGMHSKVSEDGKAFRYAPNPYRCDAIPKWYEGTIEEETTPWTDGREMAKPPQKTKEAKLQVMVGVTGYANFKELQMPTWHIKFTDGDEETRVQEFLIRRERKGAGSSKV